MLFVAPVDQISVSWLKGRIICSTQRGSCNPSAALKPWKSPKLVLWGFIHNQWWALCCNCEWFSSRQHRSECTDALAPSGEKSSKDSPLMTSPGGPVKHPLYKWRAEMVSKSSRSYVTDYPPERFGSSRQEMKGKMVVKRVLLMTHLETWHSQQSGLEFVTQLLLTWTDL